MSALTAAIASFLPTTLLSRLHLSSDLSSSSRETLPLEGVILCIGLFGLHRLVDVPFEAHDETAGEVLSTLLTMLVEIVESQGGEVLRITAEHVTALWPLSLDMKCEAHMQPGAHEAVHAASQAASQIFRELSNYLLWESEPFSPTTTPPEGKKARKKYERSCAGRETGSPGQAGSGTPESSKKKNWASLKDFKSDRAACAARIQMSDSVASASTQQASEPMMSWRSHRARAAGEGRAQSHSMRARGCATAA